MTSTTTLSKVLLLNQTEATFFKGKKDPKIKDLQRILFELGFAKELKWEKYGADGAFGNCTVKALQAFGQKNSIVTDGLKMSADLTSQIIKRHELLEDLRQLQQAIEEEQVETQFSQAKSTRENTIILQALLAALGYAEALGLVEATQLPNGIYDDKVVAALKSFSEQENLPTDGRQLNTALGQRIIDKLSIFYGRDWIKANPLLYKDNLSIFPFPKGNKTFIRVFDGEQETNFIKFKRGLFSIGQQKLSSFLAEQKAALISQQFSRSALNILISVAENEGNLDAINTYDNSFLSFGIFQWTLGAKSDKGELPALLKKLKESDTPTFEKYFGKYGINVSEDTSKTYGYLTQSQRRIKNPLYKEKFRKADWAFRFWKAGQDNTVKKVQAQHAFDRLHTFYWQPNINGLSLSQIITSEYGVALILDNHVNRPGYVKKCVVQAMQTIGLTTPPNSTSLEQQLLNAYLDIRKTYGKYPMTHAAKRASVTQKYLADGIISAERGTFQLGGQSRSMQVGQVPSFIDLWAFEEVRGFDSLF